MKKKILVVDDEQDIREIIKISLRDDGFRVLEASHGKAAIELAKKEKPDLITLDIMMPVIDGFEVAKIIKEDPTTKDIPIMHCKINKDCTDYIDFKSRLHRLPTQTLSV